MPYGKPIMILVEPTEAGAITHSNTYDFHGRVALVTGGSSGIGAATASLLRRSGATVAVADLSAPTGVEIDLFVQCDVTDSAAVDAAVATTIEQAGALDALVCAAGIPGSVSEPWEIPDDEWHRIRAVNHDGTFFACRAAARHMVTVGRGRIVNVASVAGLRGQASLAAYAATKAAVVNLTQSFGVALAPHGILVNCVTPGVIRTPLLDDVDDAALKVMVSRMPIGRMGEPIEVARLIAFLASDDLSFTTGASFDVAAGRTLT